MMEKSFALYNMLHYRAVGKGAIGGTRSFPSTIQSAIEMDCSAEKPSGNSSHSSDSSNRFIQLHTMCGTILELLAVGEIKNLKELFVWRF